MTLPAAWFGTSVFKIIACPQQPWVGLEIQPLMRSKSGTWFCHLEIMNFGDVKKILGPFGFPVEILPSSKGFLDKKTTLVLHLIHLKKYSDTSKKLSKTTFPSKTTLLFRSKICWSLNPEGRWAHSTTPQAHRLQLCHAQLIGLFEEHIHLKRKSCVFKEPWYIIHTVYIYTIHFCIFGDWFPPWKIKREIFCWGFCWCILWWGGFHSAVSTVEVEGLKTQIGTRSLPKKDGKRAVFGEQMCCLMVVWKHRNFLTSECPLDLVTT